MLRASGAVTVGVRKNNTLNTIFSKHFEKYLPERTVEVPLAGANLHEGAFDLEIRATDGSLAGFGQGNTRTVQMGHGAWIPSRRAFLSKRCPPTCDGAAPP